MENSNLGKFCYSIDEEQYHGNCETLEEAEGEAVDRLFNEAEIGEVRKYWTAQIVHPIDAYKEDSLITAIGENVHEQINDWLAEETGAEDLPVLDITKEEQELLGKIIVEFYRIRGKVQYYGITNPVEHTTVILEE